VRDPDVLEPLTAMGKVPNLAIGVEVEEAFMHCAKAFRRSGLWDTSRWPDASGLATPQRILFDHAGLADKPYEEYERESMERLKTTLY